jgi:hypothetical protein
MAHASVAAINPPQQGKVALQLNSARSRRTSCLRLAILKVPSHIILFLAINFPILSLRSTPWLDFLHQSRTSCSDRVILPHIKTYHVPLHISYSE